MSLRHSSRTCWAALTTIAEVAYSTNTASRNSIRRFHRITDPTLADLPQSLARSYRGIQRAEVGAIPVRSPTASTSIIRRETRWAPVVGIRRSKATKSSPIPVAQVARSRRRATTHLLRSKIHRAKVRRIFSQLALSLVGRLPSRVAVATEIYRKHCRRRVVSLGLLIAHQWRKVSATPRTIELAYQVARVTPYSWPAKNRGRVRYSEFHQVRV